MALAHNIALSKAKLEIIMDASLAGYPAGPQMVRLAQALLSEPVQKQLLYPKDSYANALNLPPSLVRLPPAHVCGKVGTFGFS